jgi:hypothetical protein
MPHPHILICLPTYSEEVHINFAFSLMNVTRAINESGATFETLHVASSHIIRARNFFANYFLNHSEFTHLLFLDTDMQFPPEAVIKLLKANKPLAGVAYPYRRVDLDRKIDETAQGLTMREWLETHADYTVTILSNADGSAQIVDGFVEAEHVGTGIFLAQRNAFELAKPFTERFSPPLQYRDMLTDGAFYAFFDTIEENGIYLSEDLSFCRRARLGGCAIWALLDQTVVHYGASEVSGQYMQAMRRRGQLV